MQEKSSGKSIPIKAPTRKRNTRSKKELILPVYCPNEQPNTNIKGKLILPVVEGLEVPLETDSPDTKIKYLNKLSEMFPVSNSEFVRESHRSIYTNGTKFENQFWIPTKDNIQKVTPREPQFNNTWHTTNKFEPLANLVEDYQLLENPSNSPVKESKTRKRVVI